MPEVHQFVHRGLGGEREQSFGRVAIRPYPEPAEPASGDIREHSRAGLFSPGFRACQQVRMGRARLDPDVRD